MDYTMLILIAALGAVYLYIRIKAKKQFKKNQELREKQQEEKLEKQRELYEKSRKSKNS